MGEYVVSSSEEACAPLCPPAIKFSSALFLCSKISENYLLVY
jgi:hypothetical protein